MEQNLKKIIELNYTAKIKDFAKVKTYASYIKQEDEDTDVLFVKKMYP